MRVEAGDRRILSMQVNPKYVGDSEYFTALADDIADIKIQREFFNYMSNGCR